MDYKGINIERVVHDSFKIKFHELFIYIDPFTNSKIDYTKYPKADFIFITHEHFDHCDLSAIGELQKEKTKIFGNEKVAATLSTMEINLVEPGKSYLINDFSFKTVPAYNVDKFRSEGVVFHPKENKGVGFILNLDGTKLYHTGDTDPIPEINAVIGVDIIMIPVSGTYVMTSSEAADFVKKIKPEIAIPMHVGSIVGDESNIKDFEDLLKGTNIKVVKG